MNIQEVANLLKRHAYFMTCSYKTAYKAYLQKDLRDKYTFEELMKYI